MNILFNLFFFAFDGSFFLDQFANRQNFYDNDTNKKKEDEQSEIKPKEKKEIQFKFRVKNNIKEFTKNYLDLEIGFAWGSKEHNNNAHFFISIPIKISVFEIIVGTQNLNDVFLHGKFYMPFFIPINNRSGEKIKINVGCELGLSFLKKTFDIKFNFLLSKRIEMFFILKFEGFSKPYLYAGLQGRIAG